MRTLRWYALLIVVKAYALHRIGVPSQVGLPLSGASTGIVWAYVEEKRRTNDRKEW